MTARRTAQSLPEAPEQGLENVKSTGRDGLFVMNDPRAPFLRCMSTNASDRILKCPGESVLLEAFGGVLVLTSHRVRLDDRARGGSRFISVTLDAVASCGIVTRTNPILVALGLGFALAAMLSTRESGAIALALLFAGVLCLACYLATRRAILAIGSAGETIAVPIRGVGREPLMAFVNALEQAKLGLVLTSTQTGAESGRILRAGS